MGDLTIVRNAILHSKASIRPEEYRRIKKFSEIFQSEKEIRITYDEMHKIFYTIKQDVARLLFDWLGVKDEPAIQIRYGTWPFSNSITNPTSPGFQVG
jgi:hypothetical protein